MASGNHVLYFRVSTTKQGIDGHGIRAQRQAVEAWLNGGRWKVVGEFTEVESGRRADRPELAKAIDACRLYGAKLVVAKLDRLSRDPGFLHSLHKAGIEFVAADMPNANKLTVGIMALVAEQEREAISARTKAALQAAAIRRKEQGLPGLGGFRGKLFSEADHEAARVARRNRGDAQAIRLAYAIKHIQGEGVTSASGIARSLMEKGIPTAAGGSVWSATQVQRVLARMPA